MLQSLDDTVAGPKITADKEKDPDKWEKQKLKYLHPSAKVYGELEDVLKEDLLSRGGNLPERQDPSG
jgi:hypothetical protein